MTNSKAQPEEIQLSTENNQLVECLLALYRAANDSKKAEMRATWQAMLAS